MTTHPEPGPADNSPADNSPGDKDTDKTRTRPAEPVDDLVTTTHEFVSPGGSIGYTATAGRVVLREEVVEDDAFRGTRAKAEMSVVSYVLHGTEPATRPVTFAFNGGPGSSSVWLHLGLLGPRRVLMGDAGDLLPPPYGMAPNAESLLTHSDLVFIDPVSTGFSRATDGTKPGDYHGYQRDLESVGELIRLWTTRNGRWMSPKFLAGESYGTTRAAALADHLQTRYGLYLNGLMLISSVLDMGSIGLHGPDDRGYANFLPTYAAIAHYHGKHENRPLPQVLADAEEFAARDYPIALKRGSRLTAAELDDVAHRVGALTGLSDTYVRQANLRVEHQRFFAELLRDQGLAVGRIDGRFTGPLARGTAERNDADPSMDAISGPYAAAFNHYIRDDLGYESDLHYEQIADVSPWSFSEFEGRPVDVSGRLSRAMRRNPHLKVQVAYGWHDGATPYFAAQEVFAHLDVPADLQANISHVYYPAGHMMYVHEETRIAQSADLAGFVRAAAGLDRHDRLTGSRLDVASAIGRLSPFGRLWGAYTVSAVGTALSGFALQVLVIEHLHANQQEVGWLRAAQWAPYLAFGLLAGAIADRVRRKRVLVTFDLLNAAVLVVIAALAFADVLSLLMLAILVLLRGCFGLTYEAAHQSFVPDLVETPGLMRANARLEQSSMVAQTGGPAVAGVVVTWVGAPVVLALDAITYLGSAILLIGIRAESVDAKRDVPATTIRTAIAEGLRYVYTHPLLRWYAGTLHVWFLGNALVSTLLVFFALRDLRLSAAVVGVCLALGGVSGVVGAGLSDRLSPRFALGRILFTCHVILPITYVMLILARPGVTGVLLFGVVQLLVGFIFGLSSPMELSWRNTITRPELRGRMNGTIRSVNWGMNTIAGPVAGAAAVVAGTRAAMVAGIVVLALVATVFGLSPMRSARMPDSDAVPS